jgi:hypothetical protein
VSADITAGNGGFLTVMTAAGMKVDMCLGRRSNVAFVGTSMTDSAAIAADTARTFDTAIFPSTKDVAESFSVIIGGEEDFVSSAISSVGILRLHAEYNGGGAEGFSGVGYT